MLASAVVRLLNEARKGVRASLIYQASDFEAAGDLKNSDEASVPTDADYTGWLLA